MNLTQTSNQVSMRTVTILHLILTFAALLFGVIGTTAALTLRGKVLSQNLSKELIVADAIGTRKLMLFNGEDQCVGEWIAKDDGAEFYLNDSAEDNRIVLSSGTSDANVVLINENGHLAAVMRADKEGRGTVYTMRADGKTATRTGVGRNGQGEYAIKDGNGKFVPAMTGAATEVAEESPSTNVSVND